MESEIREELVRLLPRLRSFAFGLTGNVEDADDLLQAGCERALSRLHLWRPDTRLDSWMFKILQNLWRDWGRSYALRGGTVPVEETIKILDPNAHRMTDINDRLKDVAEAMSQLTPDQRAVLMLVGVAEHSYQEAADNLGIPVGTVMSRLARARLRLAELVDAPRTRATEEPA